MQIAGFEFAAGAHFQAGAKPKAATIGAHLEMLREQGNGELRPSDIVKDARHNNSPLHALFEWDDTAAAEQHRLHQARGLIRAVVAIYRSDDRPDIRTRAYVHIQEHGSPHYREATHVMSEKSTREMVLHRAWLEFQAWYQRYSHIKEFAELFEASEVIAAKIAKKK